MEQFGGPAALGGIITGLMLGAWMLGRWQGGLAQAPRRREPVPQNVPGLQTLSRALRAAGEETGAARACQQGAYDERRAVLETDVSLGDLHAEITAYRRAEQVLAGHDVRQLGLDLSAAEAEACRYMGISGHPTCPSSCGRGADCATGSYGEEPVAVPLRAAQPSFEVPFTRV
jgi:hypothetical protein